MPRTAATGVYAAPASTFNPAVSGTVISSTVWNALLADLTTALSTESATTRAMWPLASQVQDDGFKWGGTSGGSANAHTITLTPAVTALSAGRQLEFIAGYTNTAAATLAVNAIAATAFRKMTAAGLVALTGGEIVAGNRIRATDNGTYYILADKPESTKGADIASATTTDLGAATGEFVDVTGTTTITGLGTIAAGVTRRVRFTGILILTYNATSLILPTAATITTAVGDTADFVSLGSGNWLCTNYARKDGTALAVAATSYAIKTTTYTAVAGDRILADTTSAAFTITMPASPANTDAPVTIKKLGYATLTLDFGSKVVRLPGGTTASGTSTLVGYTNGDFIFAYRGTDAGGTTNEWVY